MATNFPSSLDSLTNPTSSDSLASPSHAAQHANVNDAVEALQAKVGVDGSAVTTSLDYKLANIGTYTAYTPTIGGGVTVGNGVFDAVYCKVNKMVHIKGTFQLGSTSAITGLILMFLPFTAGQTIGVGSCIMEDSGAAALPGIFYQNSTTQYYLMAINAAGTFATQSVTSATVPFTWTTGDRLHWNFTYEAA